MNELNTIFPDVQQIRKIKKPIRVIGIDLDTANSTIAEVKWSIAALPY